MSIYDTLNDRQQEAVFCTEGPLLVLAGAGSGKTRVLTHRIAYLIEERAVNPWNILAITFTNKAAAEMKERVEKTVGFGAESIWVSTFHSTCVRILRRHCEELGYKSGFSIYDGDDQKTLMKQVLKKLDVDTRMYKDRAMISAISSAKDKLISPDAMESQAVDFREKKVALIYKTYQEELFKNNAMDFDDLINKTVKLFMSHQEILDYYQERFRYIMVDEYQDTNYAQFQLIALLANKYRNLCVVGDDDQSIYKFRGADVGNILNFEETFEGAHVVKLEQNYRSTGNILTAANQVISHNRGRKAKTLWTSNTEGTLAKFQQFENGEDEAAFIASNLEASHEAGRDWSDMAVLYRTNAQSRLLEEACVRRSVPYLLVGGVNFYQRKEIKDILAYLKTIANGVDDLAVLRIINVPKRGIGATSVGKLTIFASEYDMSLYDGAKNARMVPGLGTAAAKIVKFTDQMEEFRAFSANPENTISRLIDEIMEKTGYRQELEAEGEIESQTRMENIEELKSSAAIYTAAEEHPTLIGFLEQVALVADVDRLDESQSRVTLMTLHSAKGLEFPKVFLAGMEDGLFPSIRAVTSDDDSDLEEERRLCYVGITRAKEELVMTGARRRMINGETRFSKMSRFIEEIPEEFLNKKSLERRVSRYEAGNGAGSFGRDTTSGGSGLPWDAPSGKPGSVSSFARGNNPYASGTASLAGAFDRKRPGADSAAQTAPAFGRAFSVSKAASLDYGVGDRVKHIKFGEGVVNEVKDGAKDFEVTVCFDKVGVKKMFASFAKLQKL